MNIPLLSKYFFISMIITALAGCTAVSRQMGSITDNKYADPRSGTVWVVPPPELEPPSEDDMTVYISHRNISDSEIDILPILKQSAADQGWTVVRSPKGANYRLRATTRFFGEVEPESGGAGAAATMGLIAGAATGVAAGYAVADATGSGLGGAVAGGVVGGLVGVGIANASKPREWALIIDVVLEEYNANEIEFTLNTADSSARRDAAGTGNSRVASGGGTSKSNSTSASATRKSHYFPHGIRLSVWANQMNMKEEEAIPHIEKRAKSVITNMLPI